MRKTLIGLCALGLLVSAAATAQAEEQSAACIEAGGPSRTVVVPDAVQSYGTMQYARTVDLEPKEVVLTVLKPERVKLCLVVMVPESKRQFMMAQN